MDFIGLEPNEAMRKASTSLGLPEDFFDKMWKQESGRGTNMRSGAGARGHFQLMPATQAVWESRQGRTFDPDDFNDSLTMAHLTMKENLARFKDPVKATAAYNGGWDPKRWGNKETQGYIQALWGERKDLPPGALSVAEPAPQEAARTHPIPDRPAIDEFTLGATPTIYTADENEQPAAPAQSPSEQFVGGFGTAPALSFEQASHSQQVAYEEREKATLWGAIQTAWRDPDINLTFMLADRQDSPDHDPDFQYYDHPDHRQWESKLQSVEELAYLRENATSEARVQWAMGQIEAARARNEEYTKAGPWAAFGAQMIGSLGDPTGWAAGGAAAKGMSMLRIGHRALALAGKGKSAVASLAAEGAVGNVIFDAAMDASGAVRSVEDYFLSATLGAAFMAPGMPSVHRDATAVRIANQLEAHAVELQADAVLRKAEAATDGQTPEAIGQRQVAEAQHYVDTNSQVRSRQDGDVAVPQDLADAIRAADDGPALTPEGVAAQPTPAVAQAPAALVQAPEVAVTQQAPNTQSTVGEAGTATKAEFSEVPDADVSADLRRAEEDFSEALADRATIDPRVDRAGWDAARNRAHDAAVRVETLKRAQPGWRPPTEDVPDLDAAVGNTVAATYTPYEHAVVNEVTTLREALTAALTSPSAQGSPLTANLIRHLLDTDAVPAHLLDNIPVEFMDGVLGRFRQMFKEVQTPGKSGKELQGREANVLAHEAIHAVTARVLRAIEAGEAGVPELAKQSYQRLNDLRRELAAELERRGELTPENSAAYATKNIDEFVAQVMSDSHTRTVLSQMPGRPYEADTKLQSFIRGVLGLLGFNPKKVPPNTALAEAMTHIDTLIKTQGLLPDGVTITRSGPDLSAHNNLTSVQDRRFAVRMYEHAEAWLATNPIKEERLRVLANRAGKGTTLRAYALSDGLKLAASNNPIMRMLAGLITETTTGAAGRRTTAATKHFMYEQKVVGRSVTDYQHAYGAYRKQQAGNVIKGVVDDYRNGDIKRAYDRAVTEEILARRYGTPGSQDPTVRAGADAMQGLFQRSLDLQTAAGTLGSAYLPTSAIGYMPQALRGDALANTSAVGLEELAQHLSRTWMSSEGWGKEFSIAFARTYIDRAARRANGEKGIDFVATESPSAAVRDTLDTMRLEYRDLNARTLGELDRVGAQPQNKRRLEVDLLAVLPSGKRVLDFYSTDVELLARQHAKRVAGSSALAEMNVLGQRGVNNLLRAIDLASPEQRAHPEEREALARVFSELLGRPADGEVRSAAAANIGSFVRLQRLGGMFFTQLSEMGQITHHLGVASLFKGIAMLPRMVGEVRAGVAGNTINNPWLSSLEAHQGSQFGLEGFHLVARLDAPDELLRAYGKGSDITQRLLSGGSYFQAKFSMFRGIHAAQHRATAEMILKRALSYIESGDSSKARYLEDMGITPALARAIRGDLSNALSRDANGNPTGFDITRLSTRKAQDDLLSAVHRGTGQIIQRTFAGERGAWAHNDYAKLLLQLRTFGLVSMEKQWGRTRTMNSDGALNGYGYAAGVLLGQMAFALPVYLARVQLYAIGRDDKEEFLERATSGEALATAAMNYSSMSGLGSDAMDMVASLGAGWNSDVKAALGSHSFGRGLSSAVPVVGTLDQAGRVVTGRASVHQALKQLPFSNLPWLVPFINLTAEDD